MRHVSRVLTVFATAAAVSVPLLAAPETYVFDKAHTLIGFRVRHVLTKVEGRFKDFDGTIWIDRASPASSRVDLTVRAASIDTANDTRDNDLRSPNYFDVEKYPTITFKSTDVRFDGDQVVGANGELTMHGVTKPVMLTVTGFTCGPNAFNKKPLCGAEATATLKRSDFGMTTGLNIGNPGDEIKLTMPVEAYLDQPQG